MMAESYYRALIHGKPHLKRWDAGEFTSFQGNAPTEWYTKWSENKRAPEDFPLRCRNGVYTVKAVEAFIRFGGDPQGEDQNREASELDSVCAFTKLNAALGYSHSGRDWIVEFTGERLCVLPIEDDAVVAKVIEEVKRTKRSEFR